MENEPSVLRGLRVLISVGGDGTILRVVKIASPFAVPLIGVNLGRVGFMTELAPSEAIARLNDYVEGRETWIEKRTMLDVRVVSEEPRHEDDNYSYLGLNEIVIGRAAVARLIHVSVDIDGHPLVTYAGDSVIVSTATGSSGYNLSAGGPIMYPESSALLLKPVSPQLSLDSAIILHPDSIVDLRVQRGHPAKLTIDGSVDVDLAPGDSIRVKRSSHLAYFLRTGPHHHFPRTLINRLGSPSYENDN